MSPSARTLKYFKDNSIPAGVVERWIPQANKRVDLFGFIDIVAIYPDAIVGVQVTSGSNHSGHKKKILESDKTLLWLEHGRVELWSWSKKLYTPGGKAMRWTPRVEAITKEDFNEAT